MSLLSKRTLDPLRVTALVYVRKSFIHKDQETVSPERQLAACRAYCQQQGWKPEVYQDADEGVHYSGRTIDHRPAWQQVLQRLDEPDVAAVVVNTIDRASRSIKDFYQFFDNCEKFGVTFVATAQQIDSSTAGGKLMLAITVTFAAFEADVASDRVSATIAHKKAQGVHWGYTPFGCGRLPGGVLIPNDDISTVQRALELYADGGSYESVAQALNVTANRRRCSTCRLGSWSGCATPAPRMRKTCFSVSPASVASSPGARQPSRKMPCGRSLTVSRWTVRG